MEHILLFPTVVTKTVRSVPNEEKEIWFDLFLKHSNQEGQSHDWLGYEEIHLEDKLDFFYKDILNPALDGYLNRLNINRNNIDLHITKTFFNVTKEAGIRRHDHIENHISFTYYPHIANGKERDLMLFQNGKHANEPYPMFLENNVNQWDHVNATVMCLEVKEGVLYIFPSDLDHDVEVREGDMESGIQSFYTRKDLYGTRFCVSGDILITRNHSMSYQRTLPPVEKWKKLVDIT